jgi:hypothetical protein
LVVPDDAVQFGSDRRPAGRALVGHRDRAGRPAQQRASADGDGTTWLEAVTQNQYDTANRN